MNNKNLQLTTAQYILQQKIKARRLFLNMSYQELADKTGISSSSLQRYETGSTRSLSFEKLFSLSAALEVPITYFTKLDNDDQAVGNLDAANDDQINSHNQEDQIEMKMLSAFIPLLIKKGYRVEQKQDKTIGSILATKGKEIWHLDGFPIKDIQDNRVGIALLRKKFYQKFGMLAFYDQPITKYSIVTDRPQIARTLISEKPIHLNFETSILVIYENRSGVNEFFFGSDEIVNYGSFENNY